MSKAFVAFPKRNGRQDEIGVLGIDRVSGKEASFLLL